MAWKVLDRLVPNPVHMAGRNEPARPISASLLMGIAGGLCVGVLASAVGAMAALPWVGIPLVAIPLLLGLALVAWLPESAARNLGPQGELAIRLGLVPALAAGVLAATLLSVTFACPAFPMGAIESFVGWGAGGEIGGVAGGLAMALCVFVAWALTRRERTWMNRALAQAPRWGSVVVVGLIAVGGLRMARFPQLGSMPGTYVGQVRGPMAPVRAHGWHLVAHADEDNAVSYETTVGDVRLRARCDTDCAVTVLGADGTIPVHPQLHSVRMDSAPARVAPAGILRVWHDVAGNRVWISSEGVFRWTFRASDGFGLGVVAPQPSDFAPPWGWLGFSLAALGVAWAVTRLRSTKLAPWAQPDTWRPARIGADRWIAFADGAAPRQASAVFGTWQGEVVVVPTAAGSNGPFRGDGSPADGWVIPGTVDRLASAVRTAGAAADAYALALVVAAAMPWVAAVPLGMLGGR